MVDAGGDALARYYDLDLAEDPGDVEMYLAFADAANGPILELMAGTGRVCVPIAAAGHDVIAVDRDDHMLERARSRWTSANPGNETGKLVLVNADVADLALESSFALVIVALNSVLLLDGRSGQRQLFDTIARHLAEGGRAVIDTWLPTADDLAIYDGRQVVDWVRTDDETGETVAKLTSARYSSGTRTARITTFFDAWRDGESPRRTVREDTVSFISADELVAFAEQAGLTVEAITGDYEMGHFAPDSDRVVMVCRASGR